MVFLILGVSAIWAFKVAKSLAGKGGNPLTVWQGISNPRGQFPGQDKLVVLIVGKDYNHDKKGMPYTSDSRSDTIMLVAADLETKQLSAVSIPRDTRVSAADGVTGKINGAFQRGGLELLKRTISQEFGVDPQYYVILKDDAVKKLVDAVGGVEVEAVDDMFYDDSWGQLHVDIKKGRQRINGDQAVGYVRFRKMGTHRVTKSGDKVSVTKRTSKEEGDIRRTERQQLLLRSLVSEAMRPANLWKADEILNVGFSQVDTDLSRPQLLALATIFKSQGTSHMLNGSIPGTDKTIDGIYYWEPDPERATLTVDWLIKGDTAAGRRLVRVAVYNATKVAGVAKQTASDLDALGFTASSAGNSKDHPAKTEVIYRKSTHEDFAREIAAKIGATVVTKDTDSDPRADWLPEIKVILAGDVVKPSQSPASR